MLHVASSIFLIFISIVLGNTGSLAGYNFNRFNPFISS